MLRTDLLSRFVETDKECIIQYSEFPRKYECGYVTNYPMRSIVRSDIELLVGMCRDVAILGNKYAKRALMIPKFYLNPVKILVVYPHYKIVPHFKTVAVTCGEKYALLYLAKYTEKHYARIDPTKRDFAEMVRSIFSPYEQFV